MKKLAIIACLLPAICAYSEYTFICLLDGSGDQQVNSLISIDDINYVTAGFTGVYGFGETDFFVNIFDRFGNVEQSFVFGGTDFDECNDFVFSGDSKYVLAGWTDSYGWGAEDIFIVKFDPVGLLQWAVCLGGTGQDMGQSIAEAADGGYVVAGWTANYGAGLDDFILVKLDSSGSTRWCHAIGGPGYDRAFSVVGTSDGGFAAAGWTESYGAGSDDFFIVKVDSSGAVEWARTIGGPEMDRCYSLAQTSDSGFALAGMTQSFGVGLRDLFLARLSSDGSLEWARAYGGAEFDEATDIIEASDMGLVLCGRSVCFGDGNVYLLLVKYDTTATVEWAMAPVLPGSFGYALAELNDDNIIAGGRRFISGSNSHLLLSKFGPSGEICLGDTVSLTCSVINPFLTDVTPADTLILLEPMSVTPLYTGFAAAYDFECSTTTGIGEIPFRPKAIELSAYPNPFNCSAKITLRGGFAVTFAGIFDISGRLIESVNFRDKTIGCRGNSRRVFIWTPEKSITSGVYLLRVRTENGIIAQKKLVYLK